MRFERFIAVLSVLILLSSCLFKLFFTFYLPLGFDQAGISYISEQITHGKFLYIDYFDHKPPFMHYLLALAFLFVKPSVVSINALAFIFDLFLAATIYFVSRKFIGKHYALFAAAIYSVFNLALSLNTEILMTIFGLWGVYFYTTWLQNKHQYSKLIVAGVFIALSIWFKQSAVIFFIALVLHLAYLSYKKHITLKQLFKNVYWLTLGVLVVSLPLLLFFLYKVGAYFLYAILTFNLQFSTHSSRLLQFGKGLLILLSTLGFLLAAILPSAKYIREDHQTLLSVLTFIAVSTILFIMIQKEIFYQHFFQVIPFLCILGSLSLKSARNDSRSFVFAILIIGLCGASLAIVESNMRVIQSGELQQTYDIIDYLHATVKQNSSVFADNTVYALLGQYPINQPLVEIAPSFASVFDYKFICDQDYLVLSHRQTFLSQEVQDCIRSKFTLKKRFDNVGESYIEVLSRAK